MAGPLRSLWSRYTETKSTDDVRDDAASSGLDRALGSIDLVTLGLGAMIGAGIFVAIGEGVLLAGPAVIAAYVVAAVACIFAALCYAELAAAVPASGMAYSYTYVSLGQLMAWLIAWNLLAEYMIGNVAVAVAWSENLDAALEVFGLDVPAALTAAPGTAPGALFDLPAFLVVVAITVILAVGVRASARTNTVLTVAKIGALFLFVALGAFYFDGELVFNEFSPAGLDGVMAAAAVVFFAYIGFDAVAAAAEETKEPQRDLPVGIIGSLVAVTIVYVIISLIFVGVGGGDTLAEALAPFYGDWSVVVMAAGAVAATTSVLLVFQLGIPRILMALARDRLLPASLAEVHPRFQTPFRLTLVTGLLTAVGAAVVPLGQAINFTSLATLFVFAVTSLSVLALRRREPDLERPFKVPAAPWVVLAAVVSLGGLMVSLTFSTWLYFGVWMGLGLILYGLYGARRGLHAPGSDGGELVFEEVGSDEDAAPVVAGGE